MNRLFKFVILAGVALALLGSLNLMAQGGGGGGRANRGNRGNRGNFDPAQIQQRTLDRCKQALEVTDEAEWRVLSAAIEKVSTARREAGGSGGFGLMGRGGRGGRSGNNADTNAAGGRAGAGRGRFGTPMPEAEALQKALTDKAPAEELKTTLAAYLQARKAKLAALRQAQTDLKKLLSVRQEATAHLMGLLSVTDQ